MDFDTQKYIKRINRKTENKPPAVKIMMKRTLMSSFTIIDRLKDVDFSDIMLALYVQVDDKLTPFIKRYEMQLCQAKLNPDVFISTLHKFYQDMARYIKQNNLIYDYLDFLHFWFIKETDSTMAQYKKVINSYYDLLVQSLEYLKPDKFNTTTIVCGVKTDGSIITMPDFYPNFDLPLHNLEEDLFLKLNTPDMPKLIKQVQNDYKKMGYIIKNFDDIQIIMNSCNLTVNNIDVMIYFINEYTMDILPDTCFSADKTFQYPNVYLNNDFFHEALTKRKTSLPSNGVLAKFQNAESIKSVLFKEVYKDDTIYLLFRITLYTENQFLGYYNTQDFSFYSIYQNTNIGKNDPTEQIENFILENYYLLTCNGSEDYLLNQRIVFDNTNNNKIAVNYYYKGGKPIDHLENRGKKEDKTTYIRYDKTKYQYNEKQLNGYCRRLPIGQKASQEAKLAAIQLGFDLDDNETFVKPFIKHVRSINNKG